MVGSNRAGQKHLPMLGQDKLIEWNINRTKKKKLTMRFVCFCFLNQKVPNTRYLRETEGSPSPLQCWLGHCMSVLSWLYHCHVCRNRWLDTEQRAPKPTKKSNERSTLKTRHRLSKLKIPLILLIILVSSNYRKSVYRRKKHEVKKGSMPG